MRNSFKKNHHLLSFYFLLFIYLVYSVSAFIYLDMAQISNTDILSTADGGVDESAWVLTSPEAVVERTCVLPGADGELDSVINGQHIVEQDHFFVCIHRISNFPIMAEIMDYAHKIYKRIKVYTGLLVYYFILQLIYYY